MFPIVIRSNLLSKEDEEDDRDRNSYDRSYHNHDDHPELDRRLSTTRIEDDDETALSIPETRTPWAADLAEVPSTRVELDQDDSSCSFRKDKMTPYYEGS